jgi:hypothetical protein
MCQTHQARLGCYRLAVGHARLLPHDFNQHGGVSVDGLTERDP